MRAIKSLEFEGATLTVEYDEYGNRLVGGLRLPSGRELAYEISEFLDLAQSGMLYTGEGLGKALAPADLEVADRLFPLTTGAYGTFRRPTRDLRVAAWALAEPDWSPKRVALEAARRVPAGTRKEDFLPFVRAALTYLGERQGEALRLDEAAASFALAGEQLRYEADFRRLSGRDFDPAVDRITREAVEALPAAPPADAPAGPVEYECLECGFVTTNPRLIDAGGMGCVRCNH